MKNILLFIAGIILSVCIQVEAAPRPDLWPHWQAHDPANSRQIDHSAWGHFLARYLEVNHPSGINRMGYATVTSGDKLSLQEYLDTLQAINISRLNRSEQKAYWINLYNALTVKVVLDHYPVKTIRDIDISPGWFSNGPWDAKLLRIEGEELSLNDIEHRILRPIWQDNRIHYALNCASLSCPNLLDQAFTAQNTPILLEQNASAYINHPRGMKVEGDEAVISSIYDWFQIDFDGSEDGIHEHLFKYAEAGRREYLRKEDVHFSYTYNWNLNE